MEVEGWKNSRVLFISTTTTGFSLETKISLELIQPCIESGPPKRSVSIRCGPFRQYVLWDSRRGLLCSTWLEFENIFFFFSVLIILLLHWAIAIGRVVGGKREPSSFIHVREAFRHHLSSFGPFVAQSSSRLYSGIILRKQTIAIRQQHILLEEIIFFFFFFFLLLSSLSFASIIRKWWIFFFLMRLLVVSYKSQRNKELYCWVCRRSISRREEEHVQWLVNKIREENLVSRQKRRNQSRRT